MLALMMTLVESLTIDRMPSLMCGSLTRVRPTDTRPDCPKRTLKSSIFTITEVPLKCELFL